MSNGKLWQMNGVADPRDKQDTKDKFSKKGIRKGPRERMTDEDYEDMIALGLTPSQYRAVMGSDE